jgi:LysM repeat protein
LRRTPPLQDLPPLEEGLTARQAPAVRFGDSIKKIAQRYGITLQQLLQLNPGLDTAKLVVGSEIKLSQASPVRPNLLIGLAPSGSGGISWPELPNFGNSDKPFDSGLSASGWIWPTRGLFSSGYGWRWGRIHKVIDVANSVGTPIVVSISLLKHSVISYTHIFIAGNITVFVTIMYDSMATSLHHVAELNYLLCKGASDVIFV